MKVFVDSNILIYVLEGDPSFTSKASARLAALHQAGDDLVVSDLVRLECRVGPLRSGDTILLHQFDRIFSDPAVIVAPALLDGL